jgi:hypothetical protein
MQELKEIQTRDKAYLMEKSKTFGPQMVDRF